MPFVVKAAAMALKAHPEINASLDLDNERIVYKEYVNVGIAVDTDRGLVVPSLRNADRQAVPDLARSLAELATKCRTGNFTVEDLRGSTFTISNLGAIGGSYSTPIINPPEVAILLVGRARQMPVVSGDSQIQIRLMMPLSLSYDHRLVDGAIAARFLNEVIEYLESPSRTLLAP
jgi:pyruvate/2-oxoglutarate dehydrogenase complex dihydrolipoamide acyltransferase (E2) component